MSIFIGDYVFKGDFGRLGHGNSSDLFIPQAIRGLKGLEIKQIACGDSHCLAITGDGIVQSWGRNQNRQLGLGHTEDVLVPTKVTAFEEGLSLHKELDTRGGGREVLAAHHLNEIMQAS